MAEIIGLDSSSSVLARRAIRTALILSTAGSGIGVIGIVKGSVTGGESALVISGSVFALGILITLFVSRGIALQKIATASTVFFALYLCTGSIIAAVEVGPHTSLFIYLVWFFPLLVFNKLVNAPATGRLLARGLLVAPVLIVGCLAPRLIMVFKPDRSIV